MIGYLVLDYLYMVWLSGIMLVLLCIMEGFIGYILNYGLSYWGYMVLCGLLVYWGIIYWINDGIGMMYWVCGSI